MIKIYLADKGVLAREDAPVPVPREGEVLIKTVYTGICGTDIHSYAGETIFGRVYPFHIGHEIIGTVEATGGSCGKLEKGDHVVLDPLFTCGTCEFCRSGRSSLCTDKSSVGLSGPGGFSDYALAPIGSVFKVSKELDLVAASLAEPLSTVVNGVEKLERVPGGNVLIVGFGAIGKLHFETASLMLGAASVSVAEISAAKRADAVKMGAANAFNPLAPEDMERMGKFAPLGFDAVIDCTGSPKSVENSVGLLKAGGQLLIFGVCPASSTVSVSPFDIYKKELRIMGSFSATKKSMQEAIRLLEAGSIRSEMIVSGVMGRGRLKEALDALAHADSSDAYRGKVVISTEDCNFDW